MYRFYKIVIWSLWLTNAELDEISVVGNEGWLFNPLRKYEMMGSTNDLYFQDKLIYWSGQSNTEETVTYQTPPLWAITGRDIFRGCKCRMIV